MLLITVDLLTKAGQGHYMHKLLKTTLSGMAILIAFKNVNFCHISVGDLRRELQFLQSKGHVQSIQLQLPPPSMRRLLLKLTEIQNCQINCSIKEHRWESCWRKKLFWWLLSVTKATSRIHMPPWMTPLSPFLRPVYNRLGYSSYLS